MGSSHRRRHAHPDRHRRVNPRSERSLHSHRQEQPEDPAQDTQEPAVEERPVHILGRHRSRAAGATHRRGHRVPQVGRLPAAAQVVQFRRTRTIKSRKHVEVVYPGLLTTHGTGRPSPSRSPPGSKDTGTQRTGSTSVRDVVFNEDHHQLRTRNGPLWSRPHYVTWPWASSASSTTPEPISPRPSDPCQDDQNEPSNYSLSQTPKPTLPTLCPEKHPQI